MRADDFHAGGRAHRPAVPPRDLDAARAYEELHVAALFAEWPPRLLDRAQAKPGDNVLDVGCGTGVLARAALGRVAPEGLVTGLDISAAMLAVAESIAPAVAWRQGDATDLPFDDNGFDTVVSQFGLMFFPDRARAAREMMRVLRPGGRWAVAVWDGLDASPVYPIEVELLDRHAGHAAAEALRAPFALGDAALLSQLFESAGATGVAVETVKGRARFPSVRSMIEADLRGWLPVMQVHLDEATIGRILREAEAALDRFVAPDGALVFDSPALIAAGRSP